MERERNLFLRAALFYARRGWPVFPVKPHAKQPPLTEHGSLDAATDEKQIRAWWEKTPAANVALRTGVWSYALDIDRAHGGFETLEKLEGEHGKLPDTLAQDTGGGGRQLFYELPEQAVIKNAENVCGWQGIDVRGENGYVLVQPSVHPSGGKYVWDGERWQDERPQPAPRWLVEALLNGNGHKKRFELPEKIPHGQQHKYLVSLGGKMRAAFMGYDEIVEALWVVNQTRCEKPGPRAHIEQYARSICNYAPGPAHQPAPVREPSSLPARSSSREVKAFDVAAPGILVEDLLPRRGLTLFTGGQKMGKTILAAQAAIAVATGGALLDYYQIVRPGPVLIVETDDPGGDATFKDLWTRWDVPDNAPAFLHIRSPFQLGEEFLGWLESEIRDVKAVLVVLDSYLSLRPMRGKAGDIVLIEKQEIAALDALGKRLDALIQLIHHESVTARANSQLDWDSRGAGTFAITAAAESQLSIARFRELEGSTVRLVRARGRHMAERMVTVAYDANLGKFIHLLDGPAAPYYPLILEMRRNLQQPTFTAADLQEATGVSRATAYRHLMSLANAGAVLRERFSEYRFAPNILTMPL